MCRRRRPGPLTVLLVLLGALAVVPGSAGAQEDEAAVVAVVQELFDAMAYHDGAAVEALLSDDARFASVRLGPDGERTVRSQSRAEFVAAIAGGEGELLERMWEPQVRLEGDIATLWAPYDLWLDGELSHCGIDAFQLLRDDDGWRIVHVAYTVEREDCPESPLGPAY